MAELYDYVREVEKQKGIPSGLLSAVIEIESSWNPKAIGRNKDGSVDAGLTQINKINWKTYGITSAKDLTDNPKLAIDVGADILSKELKRFNGDVMLALAAYNAGGGRVRQILRAATERRWKPELREVANKVADYATKAIAAGSRYGFKPPSRDYVKSGLALLGVNDPTPYFGQMVKKAREKLLKRETALEPQIVDVLPEQPKLQTRALRPVAEADVPEQDMVAMLPPGLEDVQPMQAETSVRQMIADIFSDTKAKKRDDVPDVVAQIIEDELRGFA